jgi:hypothetical protein
MYERMRAANLTVPVPDQTPSKEKTQEREAELLFISKPEEVDWIENRKIQRVGRTEKFQSEFTILTTVSKLGKSNTGKGENPS